MKVSQIKFLDVTCEELLNLMRVSHRKDKDAAARYANHWLNSISDLIENYYDDHIETLAKLCTKTISLGENGTAFCRGSPMDVVIDKDAAKWVFEYVENEG
jgi:hypothetical protein